jgi:hypothetical protein
MTEQGPTSPFGQKRVRSRHEVELSRTSRTSCAAVARLQISIQLGPVFMVTAVGSSAYGASAQHLPSSLPRSGSVQTLEGRIHQDQIQLNDWTTCVSAKTPKGQAAIQKLSGEISAAKAQIAQALQSRSGASSSAPAALISDAHSATAAPSMLGSVDVWA